MNRSILIFLSLLCGIFISAQAQDVPVEDKPWKKGGMGGVTFNQVALSNWAAGGQSNLTLIGNMNLFANYKKGTSTLDNTLDLAYGVIKNNYIFDPKAPVTKAEDRIEFMSKFGKKAWSDKSFYSAFLNFRTQFAPGLQKPDDSVYISKFLSPAYLQFGIGMDFKPTDWLSVTVAPLSSKITIVADDSLADARAFGVNTYMADDSTKFTPGNSRHVRAELGATVLVKFKKDIMKNVGFESNLNLFSNYVYQPQFIDVKWNNALVAKINKYIVVNLFIDLVYDHDIPIGLVDDKGAPKLGTDGKQIQDDKLQVKQVFGLGFSYKF